MDISAFLNVYGDTVADIIAETQKKAAEYIGDTENLEYRIRSIHISEVGESTHKLYGMVDVDYGYDLI